MFNSALSAHSQVVILGGGIHGVGILHDLTSRGWQQAHLLEKNTLGSATSSASTKLIHGGLRYLQRFSQLNMVSESLAERSLLLKIASDIVKPIELMLPWSTRWQLFSTYVKCGLTVYDILTPRSGRIKRHSCIKATEIAAKAPILNTRLYPKAYSFWDAQTDDLALVLKVAESAVNLGGKITQQCKVKTIEPGRENWLLRVEHEGKNKTITTPCIINCLGPWANELLIASNLKPPYQGINNKGSHLLVPDLGLKVGLFLPTNDKRFIFMLPWLGQTLIGTTESSYYGNLDDVTIDEQEVHYMLNNCNTYLKQPLTTNDIKSTFSGLRWIAHEKKATISKTSRECLIGKNFNHNNIIFTIYGGKLTSYRLISETIGDSVLAYFGKTSPSNTKNKNSWIDSPKVAIPSPMQRFSVKML